jgi:hypothetical protein
VRRTRWRHKPILKPEGKSRRRIPPPLVSLAVATNVLSALTGSASSGLTIALDALGGAHLQMANNLGIDPSVIHRVRSGHLFRLGEGQEAVASRTVGGSATPAARKAKLAAGRGAERLRPGPNLLVARHKGRHSPRAGFMP